MRESGSICSALAAALALIATVTLAGCTSGHRPTHSTGPGSPVQASPGTLPAAQQLKLQAALAGGDRQTVATVLAPGVRTAYLKKPFAMLPAGDRITIDGAGLQVTGSAATVPATVTGPRAGRWLLELVNVGGQWLLTGTVRA